MMKRLQDELNYEAFEEIQGITLEKDRVITGLYKELLEADSVISSLTERAAAFERGFRASEAIRNGETQPDGCPACQEASLDTNN